MRSEAVKDFCREHCPFGGKDGHPDCSCLDEKINCPVDYFVRYLAGKILQK